MRLRASGHKYQTLQLLVCIAVTSVMVMGCYLKRNNNWDELAYAGAAISWSVKSPAKAQELTYAYLKRATTKGEFDELVDGPLDHSYRKAVYDNPTTFALQLPFYDVKPIYVALVWVGWKLGYNPILVTAAISAAAVGCLGLIVAWILVREMGLAGFVAYALVLLAGKLFAVGHFATPDALSALAIFSGLWLMRRRQSATSAAAFALLLLSIWIRVDNFLLLLCCSLVLCVLALSETDTGLSVAKICSYATLGLISVLVIDRIAGSYGWGILIHHTFTERIISRNDLTFRLTDYAVGLSHGAWDLQYTIFPLMFLLGGAALWLLWFSLKDSDSTRRRDIYLLAASLLYMTAHFILFPKPEFRFFVGIYMFILTLGLVRLRDFALLQSTESQEERFLRKTG